MPSLQPMIIQTITQTFAATNPWPAYLLFENHFGKEHVSFLESVAGPVKDIRHSFLGFAPLFTITVTGCQVGLSGYPAVVTHIQQQALNAGLLLNGQLKEFKQIWPLLRLIQQQFKLDPPVNHTGFVGGFFGYFGYDTAWAIEQLPRRIPTQHTIPDICLTIYQGIIQFDTINQQATLFAHQSPQQLWGDLDLTAVTQLINAASALPKTTTTLADLPLPPQPTHIQDSLTPELFTQQVEQALQHIAQGDIYQIQLGHELTIQSSLDPLLAYQRLRAINPSPYMYLAHLSHLTLVGASPELFIQIEEGLLTIRPIAGTIRRGQNAAEDLVAKQQLANNQKELAEHRMLVDLARNDISRVCQANTLTVDELMVIEEYSHVFHIVSNVTGQLTEQVDAYDVFAATFPAGTVTGAPKIRAMEIIENLETSRRGVYAGALGLIDFNGYVNTALCLRTAIYHNQTYSIRASAGIVADSTPAAEWAETLAKLAAPYLAITGQELQP